LLSVNAFKFKEELANITLTYFSLNLQSYWGH